MKRLEDYINAASSFNRSSNGNTVLVVVKKLEKDDNTTEYIFNDGVVISHHWDGGVYGFGYRDYDHWVNVVNDAGYEFDRKSYTRNLSSSSRL